MLVIKPLHQIQLQEDRGRDTAGLRQSVANIEQEMTKHRPSQ